VIVPARSFSTDPKPPAPMNTWDFLNTTIP